MARFTTGFFTSLSAARTASAFAGDPIELVGNAKDICINHSDPDDALLVYIGSTSIASFDLHLIDDQCASVAAAETFYFPIGSDRSRPSSGYIYGQFVAGMVGTKSVNFCQIVGNY